MHWTRRLILAAALIAGVAPALAQVPPPVPTLPDTERRTTYSITASLCSCNVNFALYGDSTDVGNWLEVFVNGVRITQSGNWTITSPANPGGLATAPRPITDAVLTFIAAQTGTVQIVGARRPRRASQFTTQPSARDFNQVLTDIIAQNRETWDKINDVTGRTVQAPPGETLAILPALASRQNMGACFDSGGNLQPCVAASGSFVAGAGITFTGTNPTTISTTPSVTPSLASNNTWTGTNKFNNDVMFGSGRPWCDVTAKGALHDGVTDDAPAFTACLSQCLTTLAAGSCIIFVPPASNTYCLKTAFAINTGLTTNGGIILMGGGVQGTVIAACGNNTTATIQINNQWAQIKNLSVYGYGSLEDPFALGLPTQPAILLSSGCSQCRIQDVYVTGGTAAIQINGACGYVLDNIWASFTYGDNSHIFGFINNISCGGAIINSHLDMVWPVSQPAHGIASPVAWSNGVAITAGNLRTVTCSARTWIIQAVTTATTGASSPPCHQYGTTMTDGGVSWKLVTFANSAALFADTGTVELQVFQTDLTAATVSGFRSANTFAGSPPTQVYLTNVTSGGSLTSSIQLDAGSQFTMVGTEVSYCAVTGCAGVFVNTAYGSFLTMNGLRLLNGLSYGLLLSGGTGITFANSIVSSADTNGVLINPNVTHWIVTGNQLGSGVTGQSVATAASATINYCILTNNIYHGASNPSLNQGAGSCVNFTNTGNL